MRNPEILVARMIAPVLAATAGFVAVRGIYEDAQPDVQKARIVEDVVEQYFGSDGCLAGGPYDDRDGTRNNIEVKEASGSVPMVTDILPDRNGMDTIHLVLMGTTEGTVEPGPGDHVSAAILRAARCELPQRT